MPNEKLEWFEVIDRSHVAIEMWQRIVIDHPIMSTDSEIREMAEAVLERMSDFYQATSARYL